jgi:hypothetical protein
MITLTSGWKLTITAFPAFVAGPRPLHGPAHS